MNPIPKRHLLKLILKEIIIPTFIRSVMRYEYFTNNLLGNIYSSIMAQSAEAVEYISAER